MSDRKQFIRIKDIPVDEVSGIYDGDNGRVGSELGTSCYEFIMIDDTYKIILSSLDSGFLFDLINFIDDVMYSNMPIYLIEANQVGLGTYGEPVVKNIKIVRQLTTKQLAFPKPVYKLDRTNVQIVKTISE